MCYSYTCWRKRTRKKKLLTFHASPSKQKLRTTWHETSCNRFTEIDAKPIKNKQTNTRDSNLRHESDDSYRAVVIVVIVIFFGLRLLLLGGAPFCPSAAPLLLFATARSLLLFPSGSVVAALTVGSLSAVFRLLHPTNVHGFRRAHWELLHRKQHGLVSVAWNIAASRVWLLSLWSHC